MDEQKHLVQELVNAQEPELEKSCTPKRNSKTELIQKIVQLAEEINEPLTETDSQLKRMSKRVLTEKLTTLVEKRIEFEAQKCLGITKEQAGNPFCVNLAALKMVHSIAVSSTVSLVDRTQKTHGMTLEGFMERMEQSQEQIDMILSEIAQTYPEIIEKFSSPWVRLGLLWTSNVVISLKRCRNNNNVAKLRPRTNPSIHTV
jgi:hypothetical protein